MMKNWLPPGIGMHGSCHGKNAGGMSQIVGYAVLANSPLIE